MVEVLRRAQLWSGSKNKDLAKERAEKWKGNAGSLHYAALRSVMTRWLLGDNPFPMENRR